MKKAGRIIDFIVSFGAILTVSILLYSTVSTTVYFVVMGMLIVINASGYIRGRLENG
jgi:hypothetical protein